MNGKHQTTETEWKTACASIVAWDGGGNPIVSHIFSSWNAADINKDSEAQAKYLHVEDWSFVTYNHMSKRCRTYCGVKTEEGGVFEMILL